MPPTHSDRRKMIPCLLRPSNGDEAGDCKDGSRLLVHGNP